MTTAKYEELVSDLTDANVALRDANGEFRSTYDILYDLAQVWPTLTNDVQAALTTAIAGTRQQDVFASVINQFQEAKGAMETMAESAGTLQESYAEFMESTTAHINQFKAAVQELSVDFLSSDFMNSIIDLGTKLINILDTIIDHFGAMGTVIAGIGTGAMLRPLTSALNTVFKQIKNGTATVASLGKVFQDTFSVTNVGFTNSLITLAITGTIEAILWLTKAYQEAQEAIREAGEEAKSQSNDVASLYDAYMDANSAYLSNTGSKEELTEATEALLTALGFETEDIAYLTNVYGDLDTAIQNVTRDALRADLTDMTAAMDLAGSDLEKEASKQSNKNRFNYTDEASKSLLEYLSQFEDTNVINDPWTYTIQLSGRVGTVSGSLEMYEDIEKYLDYLNQAVIDGAITRSDMVNSELYQTLSSQEEALSELYDNYVSYIENINNTTAQLRYMEYVDENGVPKTYEAFNDLIISMGTYSSAGDDFVGTTDDMNDAILNTLSNISDLSKFFEMYTNTMLGTFSNAQELADNFGIDLSTMLPVNVTTEDIDSATEAYDQILQEAKEAGANLNQAVYGNIDTNNREVLEWTEETLSLYSDALTSWEDSTNMTAEEFDEHMQSIYEDLLGNESTVHMMSGEFGGVEIAFSPMLQTENGAVYLDKNTVQQYIFGLIDEAGENWTSEDLLRLDTAGLEIDGQHIEKLLADIGDTAAQTAEQMHYVGDTGAVQEAADNLVNAIGDAARQNVKDSFDLSGMSKQVASDVEEINSGIRDISTESANDTVDFIDMEAAHFNAVWQQATERVTNTVRDLGDTIQENAGHIIFDSATQKIEVASQAITKLNDSMAVQVETFEDYLNSYIKDAGKLTDAFQKYRSGNFSNSDVDNLLKEFPQLANYTGELDDQIRSLLSDMNADVVEQFAWQINNVDTSASRDQLYQLEDAILSLGSLYNQTDFSIDMDSETESFSNLTSAINESRSATGLSAESIANLQERYQEFATEDQMASLFEATYNGVRLNVKALNELESEYSSHEISDAQSQIKNLYADYQTLTKKIENCSDAAEKANLYADRDAIRDQINDLALLASQYEGLASKYNQYTNALSTSNETEGYETIQSGYAKVEQDYSTGFLHDEDQAWIDLMTHEDMSEASLKDYEDAWLHMNDTIEHTNFSKMDFFTEDENGNITSEGLQNFVQSIWDIQDALGQEWISEDGNGQITIDFGVDGDDQFAEATNMSTEAVQQLLRALSECTDFDVIIDSWYTDYMNLSSAAEEFGEINADIVSEATGIDLSGFTLAVEDSGELIDQLNEIEGIISDNFLDVDGQIDLSIYGAQEALDMALALNEQLAYMDNYDASTVMSIDTHGMEGDIYTCIDLMQSFLLSYQDEKLYLQMDFDTTDAVRESADAAVQMYDQLSSVTRAELNLDTDEMQEAIDNLNNIVVNPDVELSQEDLASLQGDLDTVFSSLSGIEAEALVTAGVDPTLVDEYIAADHTTVGVVTWENDEEEVDKFISESHDARNAWVHWQDDETNLTTEFHRTGYVTWEESGLALGTLQPAQASGTLNAHDNGADISLKSDEEAVINELGEEGIIRDGVLHRVRGGMRKIHLKAGDIILNHKQMEELDRTGRVLSNDGHGLVIGDVGSAFSHGTLNSHSSATGTGFLQTNGSGSSSTTTSSSSTSSTTTTSTSTSNGSTVNTTTTVEDDDTEVIDWIEIAIDRIERSIDHLASIAESSYKTLKTRLSATDDEISAIMEEISTQQSAYNRYIQQANSVGLSSSLATLVKNGAIDIKEYDADTADLISDYQEWYEKALDCKDAIDELNETLAQLYESKFDNIADDYENQLSLIEHLTNTYNNNLSDVYKLNLDNYTGLINAEKQNISTLNKELKSLQDAMDEALASGTIEMNSAAWYDMVESVNEVKEAIQEATIAIGEFYAEEIEAIQAVSDNNETILDNIKTMVENLMGTTYAFDPRDYTYLTEITEKQLAEAQSNVDDLKQIYEEAMASGYVEMYSSEWYDMVNQILEAEIAVQEYENSIKDLSVQKFDDLAESLDNLLSKYEHLENLANLHLSDVFALDMDNYNKIINSVYAEQYDLVEEYKRLKEIFDDAVSSGAVASGSSDYYSMLDTLNSLEEKIMQTTIDLGDTFKSEFDAIADEFDRQSSLLDHLTNTYNNAISDAEAHGYMLSTQYYKAMQDVQNTYLDSLYGELDDLTQKMSDAVNSGTIEEGSAAWVEMQVAINGVNEEIQTTITSVQELNNEIRDLEWSYFDYGQDRISQLTQEADFLISLMSNSDLYTDNGQLTDTGIATMGLHGQNYDVYMAQADAYGQELLEINKLLAEDPNNTDLIERREELLKLQQQSILAAEDEKDAIVDMVEEGIKIELEALQDLIDAYKDSLDAAKDLHDYEKSVSSQASDIATIQKQLQAYAGDTSEETRATIQKLTSDLADAEEELAETQYEHLIDETEKLLDNLYDEYEETLNKRLDDIDALILDMIDMINDNATNILGTLNDVSFNVGYALGEGGGVYDVWENAAAGVVEAISSYDAGNMLDESATGQAIQGIYEYVESMKTAADETAESIINSTSTTTAATTPSFAIGDVNGDGLINESDVSQLLKYVHGDNVSIDTAAADINGDGVVNSADYNILQQVVGGAYSSIDEAVEAYKKANGLTDTATSATSSGTLLGDLNGDGSINITDLQALMKYTNGQNVTIDKTAADVNKDGSINITDYQLLLKYIKGEISSFASGGLVDFTGLAQLDGTKQSPEMVLSPEDTENFIALRDALESLSNTGGLQDLINNKEALFEHMTSVSTPPDIDNEVTKDISFEINIPIDHVQDYNDFVNQLRDDTKFEKLIKSMSIDQAIGKSSLAKYKYAWK